MKYYTQLCKGYNKQFYGSLLPNHDWMENRSVFFFRGSGGACCNLPPVERYNLVEGGQP